jgi:hypothetical protein
MTSPNDCIFILFVASVTVHVRELDKPPTFVSCTFVLRHVYGNCTYEVRKYHYMCETGASMYVANETHWRIFC